MTLDVPNLKDFDQRLRDEAHEEPTLEMPQDPPTKKTQIIAIYGKGGIGKSFTLANLSHMMAEQGKRVLLIGCDPKSDTTSLLFGGKACPTIIETSTRKKLAGEEVKIGDVCFKRGGVFAMELGGPEVGAAAAGAASSTASSCWRSWASTTGTSTMCCSISWATWSAAASACRSRGTWRRR
jgi:3,8-divinyl chlorophyllide a/chlorophyllide a reductase subunit X